MRPATSAPTATPPPAPHPTHRRPQRRARSLRPRSRAAGSTSPGSQPPTTLPLRATRSSAARAPPARTSPRSRRPQEPRPFTATLGLLRARPTGTGSALPTPRRTSACTATSPPPPRRPVPTRRRPRRPERLRPRRSRAAGSTSPGAQPPMTSPSPATSSNAARARLHEFRADRRAERNRYGLQRHERRQRHELPLPRPRHRRRPQPRCLQQYRRRHDPAAGVGSRTDRGVCVRRGYGGDGHGRFGNRQHGHGCQHDLVELGQVREGAQLQRLPRHDPRLRLPAPQLRDDARSLGQPLGRSPRAGAT